MTTSSDQNQFDVVAAEGTPFNAPSSERVLAVEVPDDGGLAVGLVDESDLQEQLSRMNSDFEDGLDVSRGSERLVSGSDDLGPSFGELVANGLHRGGAKAMSRLRNNPVASTIGLLGVGLGIGLLIARRRNFCQSHE